MAFPVIRATGSVSGIGGPGVSALYVAGETLSFEDTANISGSYSCALVNPPPEQVTALADPLTSTPSLVLDAGTEGRTFRLRMTRTTGSGDEVGELLFAVATVSDIARLAGLRFPQYQERDTEHAAATEGVWNKDSNTRGWHPADVALYAALVGAIRTIERVDASGGPVGFSLPAISALNDGVPQIVLDVQAAAGGNAITVSPTGLDTILGAGTSLVVDTDGGAVMLLPDLTTQTWSIVGGQGYTATP